MSGISGVPADRADSLDAALAPLSFSTRSLPAGQQFDAWREFMSPAVEIDPPAEPIGFAADQRVWDLGSFALTEASMPRDGGVRTWRHLRRHPLDHWCLVHVGGDAADGAGALHFRSLARPFEGHATDSRVLSLYIPRDLFAASTAVFDRVPPEVPRTGLGAILADYFVSMSKRLPGLTADELPRLADMTRSMIAACLAPSAEREEEASAAVTLSVLDRARRIIRQSLASPGFGPDQLGKALGVSRSRLYRLFEPFGGVTSYVQRQRLLAAHAALSDLERVQPISQIAESVGFTDPSGFSRAFKQEFGVSPSEVRAEALAGAGTAAPTPPHGDGSSLGEVLRRLHA